MNISVETVDPKVMDCLHLYNWPGNIRELKNAIETAFNNTTNKLISLEDIPMRIRKANDFVDNSSKERTSMDLKDVIDAYEKTIIANELHNANGIIAETARRLGVSKQTLKYKLSKYELR